MDEGDNKAAARKLGNYEIVRRISDGAQAAVYEARCLRDNETVAIKIFKESCADDSADTRFRREAELLQKMSHRNIVRYRDSFVARGDWDERQDCLVMEFMKGETLKERLRTRPKGMPWQEARDIIEQTMAGLIYAGEQHGVVHRDIKPSNIFVLADGQVRLFDFGIAKVGGEGTSTGGGACMGSFDYMAPDFATAEAGTKQGDGPFRGDECSDIFSLTMVFYEMLTGQLPWGRFGERPELEYLARWRTEKPKPPSHSPIAFRVIRHLTGFVDKGLSPDRGSRFRTFAEMMEAFRELRPRVLKHKGKDDYELLDGLDKGGFGEVYRARRMRDGRIVAIKRLFTDRAPRRFVKEAEILRKYSHPNLVEYVDFFESVSAAGNKQLFIVMEYLEGMPQWSLRQRIIDTGGGLNAGEVLLLFRYYLDALQYLHENVNQIIHRDIKPGNLYAPTDNPAKAKILDLGVARDVAGTETHGAAPGTWDYMAPEFVAQNSRGSPQTDIYALGLSLYEALVGTPAFPRTSKSGEEAAADFVARSTGIEKVNVDFSHEVFRLHPLIEQIVRKSILGDPRQRFQSATLMRRTILQALKEMGRIGSLEAEECSDSEISQEIDANSAATQATLFDKETEALQEWQTRVAEERRKRNVRRAVAAGCVCLAAFVLGRIVLSQTGQLPGRARAAVKPSAAVTNAIESPVKPAFATVKTAKAATKPIETVVNPPKLTAGLQEAPVKSVGAAAGPVEVATRRVETVVKPAEIPGNSAEPPAKTPAAASNAVEPPVKPAPSVVKTVDAAAFKPSEETARPTPSPSVADRRTMALKELLKDLRMLRIRNVVTSSYEAFVDDASARLENSKLGISQPEYEGVRDDPEVKREQERLWLHIAENAVVWYRNTKDGRFLAAARGALWGTAAARGSRKNAQVCLEIIRQWNEQSRQADFSKFLPLPMTETFTVLKDATGQPAKNPYTEALLKTTEFSQSSAGMFPVGLSVVLRAQAGRDEVRGVTVDLVLVPPAKTENGTITDPFYLATTETTLGMMRCYREGAEAETARDTELRKYFTGRIETQSIQRNDYPCQLSTVSEAFEFCNWLSHISGFHPVYRRESIGGNWSANFRADGFRLPTDWEWEYAARFGIDWYPAPGTVPWLKMKEEMDRDHSDAAVWFYYKRGPRSSMTDTRYRYPLGVLDLCGNMGELAMRNSKWQNMEKEQPGMVVCGGNFKNRTADKVMPWSRTGIANAENMGFRVVLPVKTEILLK